MISLEHLQELCGIALGYIVEGTRSLFRWWNGLSRLAKTMTSAWIGLQMLLGMYIGLIVGPEAFFASLARFSDHIRDWSWGIPALLAAISIVSVPPLFGYGTLITISGFAYGFPKAWWAVAAPGCLLGSTLAFVLCRFAFVRWSDKVGGWIENDQRFRGLQATIKRKGLPLIILVRLAPFPFQLSNLLFATMVDSVSLRDFLLATLAITPKLLLHVFIGAQTYSLANPDIRREMSTVTKVVRFLEISLGSLMTAGVSWYVYRQVQQAVAEENGEGAEDTAARQMDAEQQTLLYDADESNWR